MSSEKLFRAEVLRLLRRHGFAEPVEAPMYSGVPDVAYALPAVSWRGAASGWLELKYLAAWPRKPETPVRLPKLRAAQVRWLKGWTTAGGRADLLLRAADSCLAVPGHHVERVARGLTFGQLIELPGAALWPDDLLGTALVSWLSC